MANNVCDECVHYDVCLLHEDNFIEDVKKNGFCGKFKIKTYDWIDVNVRVPEDNNSEYYPMVILALKNGEVVTGCYRTQDKEWWGDLIDGCYSNITNQVTHWMHLPQPPRKR